MTVSMHDSRRYLIQDTAHSCLDVIMLCDIFDMLSITRDANSSQVPTTMSAWASSCALWPFREFDRSVVKGVQCIGAADARLECKLCCKEMFGGGQN